MVEGAGWKGSRDHTSDSALTGEHLILSREAFDATPSFHHYIVTTAISSRRFVLSFISRYFEC